MLKQKYLRKVEADGLYSLNSKVQSDDGSPLYLINPSSCKEYIYFRVLEIIDTDPNNVLWKSDMLFYEKATGAFQQVDLAVPGSVGLEDLRVFDYQDTIWFVGSKKNDKNLFETWIGWFTKDAKTLEHVEYQISLPETHVKNIVPLLDGDRLYFVDILKGVILEHTPNGLEKADLRWSDGVKPDEYVLLYGSTQFVRLSEEGLFGAFVHDIFKVGPRDKHYIHYWMEVDIRTKEIVFLSTPFVIAKFGIEFPTSLERVEGDEEKFQVMFGIDDRDTGRCTLTRKTLRGD